MVYLISKEKIRVVELTDKLSSTNRGEGRFKHINKIKIL